MRRSQERAVLGLLNFEKEDLGQGDFRVPDMERYKKETVR